MHRNLSAASSSQHMSWGYQHSLISQSEAGGIGLENIIQLLVLRVLTCEIKELECQL